MAININKERKGYVASVEKGYRGEYMEWVGRYGRNNFYSSRTSSSRTRTQINDTYSLQNSGVFCSANCPTAYFAGKNLQWLASSAHEPCWPSRRLRARCCWTRPCGLAQPGAGLPLAGTFRPSHGHTFCVINSIPCNQREKVI